jgi:hypothetical protein
MISQKDDAEPSAFEYSIEVGMLEIYNDEGEHSMNISAKHQ